MTTALMSFNSVRMQLLGIASAGYWRGLARTRLAEAEHAATTGDYRAERDHLRTARDYELIALALDKGEPLPESAAPYLMPVVARP